MAEKFNTEIEFRNMVKRTADGVVLDEKYSGRDDGIEIADFLFSESGLAVELKCIEGSFVTKDRFQNRLEETLKKFNLPSSAAEKIVFDQSNSLSREKLFFWSYVARPAEKLIRKAAKQIRSTRSFLGEQVKYGALFVAVDGADEASIGQIANLFFYVLSSKYSKDLDATVIFSSRQIYVSENGGLKSFWVPGFSSEDSHVIGDEIDKLGRLWGYALESAHGLPIAKKFVTDADDFDFRAKPAGHLS